MLRIISVCFLRAGSEVYARDNGSFGIATLRPQHVSVRGDTVRFDFPGKSGQRQVRELRDRRVARLVRELLEVPGRDVFKFVLDDGAVVDVRRRHLNDYIREVMGERFSAKDFRTWAGTLICAWALSRCACIPCTSKRAQLKAIVAAVRETASHLGNTPAVCRASYISPRVIQGFERGVVVERPLHSVHPLAAQGERSLYASERALLALLLGRAKVRAVARAA
jgi:DNA topoisomerase-1